MNKKILMLLIIGVSFASCKSKKAYSDKLRTKNVLNERNKSDDVKPHNGQEVVLPSDPLELKPLQNI